MCQIYVERILQTECLFGENSFQRVLADQSQCKNYPLRLEIILQLIFSNICYHYNYDYNYNDTIHHYTILTLLFKIRKTVV